MARIMKIRTIPRGYEPAEGLAGFVKDNFDKTSAEWFMALYGRLGNPQESGVWSYMLRHNGVVLKIEAVDSHAVSYKVWVTSGFVLEAKRRRIKALNVIARRLNEQRVVFLPKGDEDSLYYIVKHKNAELLARKAMTDDEIKTAMDAAMTDEEKTAVYGSLYQYMDSAKEEIVSTIKELFNDK